MGVDLLALLSMSAALALGEALAGAIVAVMYAGGQALEDYAVGRAERDLKALIDRAPRVAHRKRGDAIDDVPIDQIAVRRSFSWCAPARSFRSTARSPAPAR